MGLLFLVQLGPRGWVRFIFQGRPQAFLLIAQARAPDRLLADIQHLTDVGIRPSYLCPTT